jgi:hypothetical protein
MPAEVGDNLKFALRKKGSLPETLAPGDLKTLNSGLRFLLADLRAAGSEFGENRRHGSVMALGALMRFIILFKPSAAERLDLPILVLRGALLDLDEKIVDPLLRPVRGLGPPPSSMARQALKGHVAAAVQRLFQAGMSTSDAHRLVAKELKKLGLRPERGSGDLTATTVRHWCDEVVTDRTKAAAEVYDRMFTEDEVNWFNALDSDQTRKKLALASLAAFVRAVIGAKNPPVPPT